MTIFMNGLQNAVDTLQGLQSLASEVDRAAAIVAQCLTSGGKLLVCGNGGSAADGADFATEFACRFVTDRQPFPALNLTTCGSLLTAIGNDYGFEQIFSRQVAAFAKRGDVLVAVSTSGKSQNVIGALQQAQRQMLTSIALLGRDGGEARGLATVELIVRADGTARIQEAHKFLLHVICEIVESNLLL